MALTEKGRWEKADVHAKSLYDANMDRYICPKHAEQYRDRSRVRFNTNASCEHKPDWRKVGKNTKRDLALQRFQSYDNLIRTNETYPEICVNKYPDHPHLKWSEDMGYCCGSTEDNQDDFKNYLIFMINNMSESATKTEPTNIKPVLNMIKDVINRLNPEDQDEVRQLLNDKENEINGISREDAEADSLSEARWTESGERDAPKIPFGPEFYIPPIAKVNAKWDALGGGGEDGF